jgi:hypothetical protein
MNDLQSVTPCRPHLLVVIVVVIAKHLGLEVNYTEIQVIDPGRLRGARTCVINLLGQLTEPQRSR